MSIIRDRWRFLKRVSVITFIGWTNAPTSKVVHPANKNVAPSILCHGRWRAISFALANRDTLAIYFSSHLFSTNGKHAVSLYNVVFRFHWSCNLNYRVDRGTRSLTCFRGFYTMAMTSLFSSLIFLSPLSSLTLSHFLFCTIFFSLFI